MIARLIAVVRGATSNPASPLYVAAGAMLTAAGLTLLSRYQRAQLEAITGNAELIQHQETRIEARTLRLAELRRAEQAAAGDQALEDRDA